MKAVFDDPQFSFQMLRLMGSASVGQAEVGECLAAAYRIEEGNFESWYTEWLKTARRVHLYADDSLAGGHRVSAREAYLRASNYYRAAEFYLHGDPSDPRIKELSDNSVSCFDKAMDLLLLSPERVEIPYEGITLPGIFYAVDDSGAHRPILILQTGFDGTIEELYAGAASANRRGFNALTFEGPGQGRVIREQGLPFRPDWEKVVTPVVDYALSRGDVDPDRIALIGYSFGGYLAPRAAAFEPRLAACIADGGIFDFMGSRIPPGTSREEFAQGVRDNPDDLNKGMEEMMKTNTEMRWAVANGMYTFAASTPAEWMDKCLDYELSGAAEKIRCPTLVIDGEEEASFPGQAKKLYDALTCPKEFLLFTAEEGAGDHCQVGTPLLSQQKIFDWLEEVFEKVK
ncbi:MAG: alpha/beta fold hydrolase [Actinomycetota bacterium]|nr:alpha/beta fold hydrolase [Actinomycetota bacterium]